MGMERSQCSAKIDYVWGEWKGSWDFFICILSPEYSKPQF